MMCFPKGPEIKTGMVWFYLVDSSVRSKFRVGKRFVDKIEIYPIFPIIGPTKRKIRSKII